MPVTSGILQDWANRALIRAGQLDREVSKMWAYRFTKRLPPHLQLRPVVQKTKDSKRIDTEQAGPLSAWYNQLKQVTKKPCTASTI